MQPLFITHDRLVCGQKSKKMDIDCIYNKTREKTKPFWLSIQKIIYNFADRYRPYYVLGYGIHNR